jgi:hypothetical protein
MACMFMQPILYRERSVMPHRARLVWRDLVTTAAPIARNIDGYLAHQATRQVT